MTQPRSKAIFLSYDGYGQSYLETLYLPILGSIENPPVDFTVVQFMPKNHPQKASDAAAAEKLGIKIHFLNYYNSPPLLGTIYLILNGIFKVGRIVRKEKIDFIHARLLIPGIIALAATLFRPQVRLIYDLDGFVPEARVEAGLWSEKGFIYKTLKKVEKLLVKKANLILVRTEKAKKILSGWYGDESTSKTFVTPNSKDESVFHPFTEAENREIRQKYNLDDDTIFVIFAGTFGSFYMPDKMFRLFSYVKKRQPNSFFLILTVSDFEPFRHMVKTEQLTEEDYKVEGVLPVEVPRLISAADVGISFRIPQLSLCGIAPIKVCEYLLCGTPVIATASTGDMNLLFKENKELGFLVNETSDDELKQAAEWILKTAKPSRDNLRETSRAGGVKEFGLSNIKKLYEDVYRKLIDR